MSEGDTSGPDPHADTDGADQEDQRETIDPEVDLLHRYESIVQTQVDTLNGIDDKAAKTARLIGVLGGLVLTGTSLAASVDVLEVSSDTAVGLALLLLGTAALFGSLHYHVPEYAF